MRGIVDEVVPLEYGKPFMWWKDNTWLNEGCYRDILLLITGEKFFLTQIS